MQHCAQNADLIQTEQRARRVHAGFRMVAWSLEALLAELDKNPERQDLLQDIGEGLVSVMELLDRDARSLFTFF